MQVMAINGSPRKEKSSTYHILGPLLEGMRAAGATTELVHLGHLQIKPCLGCFLCWVKTPGNACRKMTWPRSWKGLCRPTSWSLELRFTTITCPA